MAVQLILFPQNYQGGYNSVSTPYTNHIADSICFVTLQSSLNTIDALATATNQPMIPRVFVIPLPLLGIQSQAAINQFVDTAVTMGGPMVVNAWYSTYSYNSTSPVQSVNAPSVGCKTAALYPTVNGEYSSIVQKLSGLAPGTNYDIHVDLYHHAVSAGHVTVFGVRQFTDTGQYVSNGIMHIFMNTLSSSHPDYTYLKQFTAHGANDILEFWVLGTIGVGQHQVDITKIQVTEAGITPTGNTDPTIDILGNGEVICDLYEDEDIPLTLSVDNFKNVAEKVQSYSKSFKIPATKRNNKILDFLFDITRADNYINFNVYKKTQCILKEDGIVLFEGYMKVNDIIDKGGEISYSINLYSEVVALADVLKDKKFSNLDFTELDHDYTKHNVRNSWNDGTGTSIVYLNTNASGYREAYSTLKYPFVDWDHQMTVAPANSSGSGPTENMPKLGSLEQVFRPWIQLKYLINRIFQDTPFTWESTFFDSAEFEKLYMDFNWGSDVLLGTTEETTQYFPSDPTNASTTSYKNALLPNIVGGSTSQVGWSTTTGRLTSTQDNTIYTVDFEIRFTQTTTSSSFGEFLLQKYDSLGVAIGPPLEYSTITFSSGPGYDLKWWDTYTLVLNDTEYVEWAWRATVVNSCPQSDAFGRITTTINPALITSNQLLQTLRGELGQWEFIKGIMTMFNLISMPDKDDKNNIIFETYSDVFINDPFSGSSSDLTLASRGIQHDWTDKIDITQIKLKPLTTLNKITKFGFAEDDDDYPWQRYKQESGHEYGSKTWDASGFTILTGTKDISAEPFAATMVKPLMSQFPLLITPSIYAYDSGETEGFENSPRICYNNGIVDMGTETYYIPAAYGLASENQPRYLQFSHLSNIPSGSLTYDYHFGECQYIPGVGQTTSRNLFNLYWLPYLKELYHADTRTLTMKVNLNAGDISTFQFNDKVFIKDTLFRVNKIEYKPGDLAKVEFVLIGTFSTRLGGWVIPSGI